MNAPDRRTTPSRTLHLNLIGGERVPARDDRTIDVICPSDGLVFAAIARSGAADIDAAVNAARAAFEGAWGKLTATERGRLLVQARRGRRGAHRRTRRARIARHRQAAEPGPRRHGRDRALLRVLRQRRRQGARRDDPLPQRLHRRGGARSARRHRPHRPVELSGADLRPLGRRLARLRQRLRGEAGRGRVPDRSSASPSSRSRSASRRARSTSSPASARRRARRSPAIRASTSSPSPAAPRSARSSRRRRRRNHIGCTLELGGKSPQVVFADADLDAAAPVLVQGDRPERRPDLLGRQPRARRAARLRRPSSRPWPSVSRKVRAGPHEIATSISAR